MAVTYSPLASQTLGASASSVTFSGIPQTYTDLVLVASFAVNTSTSPQPPDDYPLIVTLNSDTGSNYSMTRMSGNGTSAASLSQANQSNGFWNGGYVHTSGEWENSILHFMNYSNTTTYKTILSRINSASTQVTASVNLWRSTSAITTIKVAPYFNISFMTGSQFTIYGIKAA